MRLQSFDESPGKRILENVAECWEFTIRVHLKVLKNAIVWNSMLIKKFCRVSFGQIFKFVKLILFLNLSHCDIITFRLGSSLLGSTFVFTRHFGAKTICSRSHFEDDFYPHISGSGSSIRINLTFVLFKHVILRWINFLETWLRSDNTSCYYNGILRSSLAPSNQTVWSLMITPG